MEERQLAARSPRERPNGFSALCERVGRVVGDRACHFACVVLPGLRTHTAHISWTRRFFEFSILRFFDDSRLHRSKDLRAMQIANCAVISRFTYYMYSVLNVLIRRSNLTRVRTAPFLAFRINIIILLYCIGIICNMHRPCVCVCSTIASTIIIIIVSIHRI